MTPREWAEKALREADTMHGPDLFDIERTICAAVAEEREALSLDGEAHSFVMRQIADAREEGRAAGYAEAIEACIQECEIEICELTKGPLISNHATYPYNLMMQRFRALAPATTKEQP